MLIGMLATASAAALAVVPVQAWANETAPRAQSLIAAFLCGALSAFVLVASGMQPGQSAQFGQMAVVLSLAAVLAAASIVDINCRIVPNQVVAAIAALGVLRWGLSPTLVKHLATAVLFGGALLLFCLVFERILGKEAMGGGDVKMLAALALLLGVQETVWILVGSCGFLVFWSALSGALRRSADHTAPMVPCMLLAVVAISCLSP